MTTLCSLLVHRQICHQTRNHPLSRPVAYHLSYRLSDLTTGTPDLSRLSDVICRKVVRYMKGYKPEVTNPQNCKKMVSHFIQLSKQICFVPDITNCYTYCTVLQSSEFF
jgi:hypothetical protein